MVSFDGIMVFKYLTILKNIIIQNLCYMQLETSSTHINLTHQQLVYHIRSTYSSHNSQQIQISQRLLLQLPKEYIEKIFSYLLAGYQCQQQFKVSATLIATKLIENNKILENTDLISIFKIVYELLITDGISYKVKDNVAKILGLLLKKLNVTQRTELFFKAIQRQESTTKFDELYGILAIYYQFFKNLDNFTQIISHFTELLPKLSKTSLQLSCLLQKNIQIDPSSTQMKSMYLLYYDRISLINKLLQLIHDVIIRINQQQHLQYQLSQIRLNQNINRILNQYLNNFLQNGYIIPTKLRPIYQSKQLCLDIIENLYRQSQLPQQWIQLFYRIFAYQASIYCLQDHENIIEKKQIICKILDILSIQLKQSANYSFFTKHQLQSLFCLFNFSVSTKEEIQQMNQDPEKFCQIADGYSLCSKGIDVIKVKASLLLKTYAEVIDGFLKLIVQISLQIISGCLAWTPEQIKNCQFIREQYKVYPFVHYDSSNQLETILLALTSISPLINKRKDLKQIILSIFFTYGHKFTKITDPLVLNRLIHCIGFYPSCEYLLFVRDKIKTQNIYKIEGFKCFQRVLQLEGQHRNNFEKILQQIFLEMVNQLNLDNSLAQVLIINNYQTLLKSNQTLLLKTLNFLQQTFSKNYITNSHQAALAMNFLNNLLDKETQIQIIQLIESKIQNVIQICKKKNKNQFQEKIIEMYIIMVVKAKEGYLPQRVLKFCSENTMKIASFGNNSKIFMFYNKVFYKFGFNQQYKPYLTKFMSILFQLTDTNNTEIIPHLCYLISEIIILDERHFSIEPQQILKIINYCKSYRNQRTSFLIVLLSLIFAKPYMLIQILKQQEIYFTTLQFIFQQQYEGTFMTKIFVLAMCKLLQIESQEQVPIINICIETLYRQFKKNSVKIKNIQIVVKTRGYEEFPQEEVMQQMGSQFIANNSFFQDFFRQLKHPIIQYSQYDNFKQKIWLSMGIEQLIDQQHKQKLKQIMDTEWVDNKTRKIFKVKSKHNNIIGFQLNNFQSFTNL